VPSPAAFFPLLEKLEGASNAEKNKPDLMADVDFEHRKELDADEHEQQKRTRLDAVKDLVRRSLSPPPPRRRALTLAFARPRQLAGNPSAPPSHPSGILSYQIHSVADLELDKRVGAVHAGLKRLKPGTTFKAMHRAELPSTYVQAILNDEMVFRTKLSPFSNGASSSSSPFVVLEGDGQDLTPRDPKQLRRSTVGARRSCATGRRACSTSPSWTTATEVRPLSLLYSCFAALTLAARRSRCPRRLRFDQPPRRPLEAGTALQVRPRGRFSPSPSPR